MPSQLVDDVRALIRARTEEGRPLTMPERALLLATLAPPRRDGVDVVDELEAAIATGRRTLLEHNAGLGADQRAAARRLLAAARAVLDYTPGIVPARIDLPDLPPDPRPRRADVDG